MLTTTAIYRQGKAIEILSLIANGATMKEAAARTGVHPRTCEKYIEYMRKKYGAKSTSQLVYVMTKKELI